jgi:NAD(P)-dependent dehydrogenase (short-subunit alcohol dehydrogenase family)
MSNDSIPGGQPGHRRLLKDTVAVVTDASRGIGTATARAFAAAVAIASRDEEQLDATAEQIQRTGGEALAVPKDVIDPAAVKRLVDHALAYGRLDAAFNHAGLGQRPTPLAELSVEDFDRALVVVVRVGNQPAAVLESGAAVLVRRARSLDDTIEGQEGGDDQSHLVS